MRGANCHAVEHRHGSGSACVAMKRTSIAITVGIRRYAQLFALCIALLFSRLARGSSDSRENSDKPGVHPELDTDSLAHIAALPFKRTNQSQVIENAGPELGGYFAYRSHGFCQ